LEAQIMYIKEMKESHSTKHKSNPPYLMKDTAWLHNCRRTESRANSPMVATQFVATCHEGSLQWQQKGT